MSTYVLNIQTAEELLSSQIECDNNKELKKIFKQALTEGLNIVGADGKSGRFIPGPEIKNIKWRNSNSHPA